MFRSVFIPIGVGTFDQTAALTAFSEAKEVLQGLDTALISPPGPLLSADAAAGFCADVQAQLAVVFNNTFANGAYTAEVLRALDCPVLLWTPEEPYPDTGRLKLNALTGAFSAANMMRTVGRPYVFVYGSPKDPETLASLRSVYGAARVKAALRTLDLLQVGHTPQGFGFGRATDAAMQKYFGARLHSIEARELIDAARAFTEEDVAPYLADAKRRIAGLDRIEQKNVLDFARLYRAYDEYIKQNHIGALASRCWPDFFTAFGTPVCAVLSILGDLGVPAACEADAYGALSMFIAAELTGKPAFFGDPVALDKAEDTVTFWHCGTAACSLARTDTGAEAGVHCNRRIGPTLEFGCKPEKEVTVLRVGLDPDGKPRILAARGEALDRPKQYFGTSIVVRPACGAQTLIHGGVAYGWEPHFAIAMADVTGAIDALGKMLGVEVFLF